MTNRKPSALSRLRQDYLHLKRYPVPHITAEPSPTNILKWHYVIKGPKDSVYEGGYYHGVLIFPHEFPFKPPSIIMLTPNGRFRTAFPLCLSNSDNHPEYWTPVWSVATILTGLLSFMLENTPTFGSIETGVNEKKNFAMKSLKFNLKNSKFRELFPEISEDIIQQLKDHGDNTFCEEPPIGDSDSDHRKFESNSLQLEKSSEMENKNSWLEGICDWKTVFSYFATIVCFVVFALIVNYTVVSLDDTNFE